MRRAIIYIGILTLAASCRQNDFRPATGDLLFQVGKSSDMGLAIEVATGKEGPINFTHVAIAVRSAGADSVIEASTEGGVRLIGLGEFLEQSARVDGKPVVIAMRLRDTTGIARAIDRARARIGLPYDYSYLPANDKIYCSELVWESYLAQNGSPIFQARPMNFLAHDGSMPRFWTELFDQLGEPIPQNVPGTNPNDMAQESILRTAHRYF